MNIPEITKVTAGQPHAGATASASSQGIDHKDRDAFGLRLQQHYHQHAVNETPFLLMALRGDGEAAQALDFSRLYQCALNLFKKQDDWLVDVENKRLIVLLPAGKPDDARRFFARLKIRLHQSVPEQAEAYLYAISAITVANGAPFQNAEDFLSVALEEE